MTIFSRNLYKPNPIYFGGVILLLTFFYISGCAGSSSLELSSNRDPPDLEPVVIRTVTGEYEQIWEDLQTALSDRGLVVSSVSHIGDMLVRTGQSFEGAKKIFSQARGLVFCSAVLSRTMMETNPHFIAFCPYQITVYSLPGQEGTVYLSYRRLIWNNDQDREPLEKIEQLLDGLVGEVIELQELYR